MESHMLTSSCSLCTLPSFHLMVLTDKIQNISTTRGSKDLECRQIHNMLVKLAEGVPTLKCLTESPPQVTTISATALQPFWILHCKSGSRAESSPQKRLFW